MCFCDRWLRIEYSELKKEASIDIEKQRPGFLFFLAGVRDLLNEHAGIGLGLGF